MVRQLFAADNRFATGGDRVRIVEADRHGVHMRFTAWIDPAFFLLARQIKPPGQCLAAKDLVTGAGIEP